MAEALRAIRTSWAWSQDAFAAQMRFHGFLEWNRATVAAVETGRRRLTLGELFGVSRVLEIPIPMLLVWNHDRVALTEHLETRAVVVRYLLGQEPTAKDAEAFQVTMPANVADMDRISNTQAQLCMFLAPGATQQMLLQAAQGELEQTIARQIADESDGSRGEGWRIVVAAAARGLYDKSATEERDARATSPDKRQHMSRAITAEIIAAVNRALQAYVDAVDRRFPGRPVSEEAKEKGKSE